MDLPQAPDQASTGSVVHPDNLSRIPERWLALARTVWIMAAVLAVTLFVASLPAYYDQLRTACTGSACISHQLTPEGMRSLREYGLSVDFYAAYSVALAVLFTGVCTVIAAVIVWCAPGERMALLGALMLVLFGVIFPETPRALALTYPLWYWPVSGVAFLGFVSVILFINLFPGGRFVPRWTRWAALVWIIAAGQGTFFPDSTDRPWVSLLNTLGFVCAASASLGALAYRYLRKAGPVQRQQIKWVILGITTGLGGVVGVALLGVIFPALGPPGLFDALGIRSAQIFLILLIPLSIGIAILRYRLWEIDLIINRTLVYGALTVSVVGLYVLVVGGLGTLLQARGNLLISLFATGLVAVLFAPLRNRLQRGVNHLMYGDRDDPYAVLSRLGQRLEATLEPRAVLPVVVETVAQALKLPYAAIVLEGNGERDGYTVAAAYGSPVDSPLRLPLAYRNEPLGELLLAARAGEESFSASDRRLLEDLARQAGVAAHAVRLTADLQRARERLVSAREEERWRLRRDLHDGLGPQLSSQTLTIDAVRTLIRRDPDSAEALLLDLKAQAQDSISDIRRLVYELRPPALDDLGFVAALGEIGARQRQGGLDVSILAPESLPPLPAAVEVAAYRIVQEAITNVGRHAEASVCFVSLEVDEDVGMLRLEVRDDGRGIGVNRGTGVGLTSMRERAEELGGSFTVDALPGGGTIVRARLPLPEEG